MTTFWFSTVAAKIVTNATDVTFAMVDTIVSMTVFVLPLMF